MPIVVIIDLMESLSRYKNKAQWNELYRSMEDELNKIKTEYHGECIGPQIVLGDSVEILSLACEPVIRTIHAIMTIDPKVRIGIGVGRAIIVDSADINRCTGEAFDLARQALEEAKQKRKLICIKWRETISKELESTLCIVSFSLYLAKLNKRTIRYLFDYIWRRLTIKSIAEKYGKSISSVYITLERANAEVLRRILRASLRKTRK